MKRSALYILARLALPVLLWACGARTPSTAPGSGTGTTAEAGLAAFETVRGVLQHARCQNCHPRGDTPLQVLRELVVLLLQLLQLL